MALTNKQQLFADKYLETLNATQSAIFAGYSVKSADVIGCENLGKPKIAEYIETAMKKKNNDLIMSQEEVLSSITTIARQSNDEKNKLKALELMGKRYAIFIDKVDNNITSSGFTIKVMQEEDD